MKIEFRLSSLSVTRETDDPVFGTDRQAARFLQKELNRLDLGLVLKRGCSLCLHSRNLTISDTESTSRNFARELNAGCPVSLFVHSGR